MNSFMLIIILISLLTLSGITIYYLYDYMNYKKSIKDNIDSSRATLQNEETQRLATYSSVVDQINTINYDIHNKINGNFGKIEPIQDKVEKTIDGLIQVTDVLGDIIPLSNVTKNLPNNATYNFVKNFGTKKGMNVKNLDKAGNRFVITGKDMGLNTSNSIVLPDDSGNTIIQNIDPSGNLVFFNHDNTKNIVLDGNSQFNNNIILNSIDGKQNTINTKTKNPMIVAANGDLTSGSMSGDNTIYGNKIGLFSRGNGFSIGAGADMINNEISLFVDNKGGLNMYKPINLYDPVSKKLYATLAISEENDLVFQAVNNIVLNTGKMLQNKGTMEVDNITVKNLQGSVLPQGPLGEMGSQGIEGDRGSSGTIKGIQGSAGIQGVRGIDGLDGATGLKGSTGPRGPTGIVGFMGQQGSGDGPQGIQGDRGSHGLQGDRGSLGDLSFVLGSQGSQGTYGSRADVRNGEIGDMGSIGSQGPRGERYVIGSQGYQGSQGSAGSKGIIGTSADRGDQGSQGYVGSKGSLGSQGSKSLSGERGSQGSKGSMGVMGSYGLLGPQGWRGYRGSQQGSQGSRGIQGSKGSYKGEKGSQGYPNLGSQGFKGSMGSAGVYYTGSGHPAPIPNIVTTTPVTSSITTSATTPVDASTATGMMARQIQAYQQQLALLGYYPQQNVDGTWNFVQQTTGATIPVSSLPTPSGAGSPGGLIPSSVPGVGTSINTSAPSVPAPNAAAGTGSFQYASSTIGLQAVQDIATALGVPITQADQFYNLTSPQQRADFINNNVPYSKMASTIEVLNRLNIAVPGVTTTTAPAPIPPSPTAPAPATGLGALGNFLMSGAATPPAPTAPATTSGYGPEYNPAYGAPIPVASSLMMQQSGICNGVTPGTVKKYAGFINYNVLC